MAGVKGESSIIKCASGNTVSTTLGNASNGDPWGEACLEAYQANGIHINGLADTRAKSVGIGMAGKYTMEEFGEDPR